MKECQVIHIRDHTWRQLIRQGICSAAKSEWEAAVLAAYLNGGYDILEVIIDASGNDGRIGLFGRDGAAIVLVREIGDDLNAAQENWLGGHLKGTEKSPAERAAEIAAYEEAEELDVIVGQMEITPLEGGVYEGR